MERVLVVGATGNIGVSAIIAALRSKREVLALVRNQAATEKLYRHVGTKTGITTVEADATSEEGVQSVVDRVRAGKLPSFQHVYEAGKNETSWNLLREKEKERQPDIWARKKCTHGSKRFSWGFASRLDGVRKQSSLTKEMSIVGVWNPKNPLYTVDLTSYRETMKINAESAFSAYRATIPYLLEQGNPHSTWTMVTGGAGRSGVAGVTAVSQGALFSLAAVASRELDKTNVRFNEAYLDYRVEYDANCDGEANAWKMKASDYAKVYEAILADEQVKGCRVTVESPKDLEKLRYQKKLAQLNTANSWGQ
ncbi:hypothetical protein A1O1_07326 [Capronia coronata CBS 617.96]|uniref:NmrA-like domain-containing protein n=1 Tax=Capronia coronata CBS 617.96 TaxID=1182541 RepID=W9XT08_9EURO|nr:uncharacterized protein A1O1_07326 [Capronia coronata CBS 617.96]EXJ83702.1 hypothetical protein A1O1_07326 [Capronia coronata CBS 617.96]